MKFIKLLRSDASLPEPVMCTIPFPVRISGHSSRHGVHSLGNPKDFPLPGYFQFWYKTLCQFLLFCLFSEAVINSYVSWFSRIQQMGKCLHKLFWEHLEDSSLQILLIACQCFICFFLFRVTYVSEHWAKGVVFRLPCTNCTITAQWKG